MLMNIISSGSRQKGLQVDGHIVLIYFYGGNDCFLQEGII